MMCGEQLGGLEVMRRLELGGGDGLWVCGFVDLW